MEDFKDVMLSEPPQRYAGAAPTHATSNALSLESYKGILLCDRPADTRAARSSAQPVPFLPPGNTDMDRGNGNLGLQPSIEARAKGASNRVVRGETQTRSKNTALSKHRQWLTSFATEMKKMKGAQAEEDLKQTVRAAALRDREAAKRRGEGSLVAAGVPPDADAEEPPKQPSAPPTPPPAASKKAKSEKKKKQKPKWAMTEDEAEEAEFDEARELMDFAAELDYDSFIKDFEVQEALAIMRDRVREIADEKGIDIDEELRNRDDDTASIATASTVTRERKIASKKRKQQAEADGDDEDRPAWDDSTNVTIRKALQGDALKLAERVLQSSEELRKVHSKMSMAKLLGDVAMEVNAGKTQRQVTLPQETVMLPPVVATVSAEATGTAGGAASQPTKRILTEMRQSKTKAQNLPYMYRCPSI